MTRPMPLSPTAARRVLAAAALAAALAGCASVQAPPAPSRSQSQTQSPRLAVPAERLSDEAIQRDHRAYEAVQGRIRALNDGGRRLRDLPLAQAQCWLDVSFHEYTRNDRSAFPQAALDEAARLVAAMESGASPQTGPTPLVNGAARLRPDLWARTEALRRAAGFSCAQQRVGCAEVELVHAGNEFNQQQWRHASPYIQIAEDLIADAEALAARCPVAPVAAVPAVPPAPVPPVVPVTPAPPAAPRAPDVASVMFDFNRSGPRDIRPASLARLDALLARLAGERLAVVSVRLAGHADRLNDTGNAAYNQRLSEKRVATVRDLLVARGVDAALIRTVARGDAQPVVSCAGRHASRQELTECLLPNRRVEVIIDAVPRR